MAVSQKCPEGNTHKRPVQAAVGAKTGGSESSAITEGLQRAESAALVLESSSGETFRLYQAFKERAGKLDFLDVLIKARDLLDHSSSVRTHFQERFR